MKLLIIGGAGHVGTLIKPTMEAEFECTHFDLKPVHGAEDRTIVADVGDDAMVQEAVQDRDAILYLAMGVGKKTGTCQEIDPAFDVNVRGLYRFLKYSLAGGAKRFVYASTLSVYRYLHKNCPVTEEDPADSWEPYGLSKRVGEFICEAASQEHPQATVVAIRLMMPCKAENWRENRYDPQSSHNGCGLGPNDTQRLFQAAVHLERPGFHLMQATGDLEGRSYPNTHAHTILNWAPQNQ